MEKMTAIEKFICENSLGKIKNFLMFFANCHAKKLPIFLNERVMLDILKIKNQDVFLPVAVNSNLWLGFINGVREEGDFKICFSNEKWPFRQRFELIGGFKGIIHPECAMINYLKSSFNFWDNLGKIFETSVSERVADLASSKDFKSLIKKVQVIELSEEYKAEEVDVF